MVARILGGTTVTALLALPLFVTVLGGGGSEDPPTGGLAVSAVPAQYQALVLEAGSLCPQITPSLIAAQIDAESGWNPNAGSSAGAQGIAQFMPSTWAVYGRDYNGNGNSSPLDPGDAIPAQGRLMCTFAAQMQEAKERDAVTGDVVDLALASYNAGAGAVLNAHGVPAIPETQQYVARIKQLLSKYTFVGLGNGKPGQALPPGPCSLVDWTQPGKLQPNGAPACLSPRMDALARALVQHGFGRGTHIPGFYCWDWHAFNPTSDHRRGAACDLPFGPGAASGQNLADGTAAANWIVAHAAQFGVRHVIWQGKVWTSWEPRWVPYDGGGTYDPTSPSGGHYDHVHVSVW